MEAAGSLYWVRVELAMNMRCVMARIRRIKRCTSSVGKIGAIAATILVAVAPFAASNALAVPNPANPFFIPNQDIILVGTCRGYDCGYSSPEQYEPEPPVGACREDGYDRPPPSYFPSYRPPQEECGIRCTYGRLRNGFCGPGCDWYRFRMYEYRQGNYPPRRCR